MNKALQRYIQRHNATNDGIRLGQRFCNDFIKSSWPELFYATDTQRCVSMIETWLAEHHYQDTLPTKVDWSNR